MDRCFHLCQVKICLKHRRSVQVLLAVVQSDLAPLHHVHQSAWRGHQQVAASLQVSDLLAYVGSSVHHAGTHSGPVGKLRREEEG